MEIMFWKMQSSQWVLELIANVLEWGYVRIALRCTSIFVYNRIFSDTWTRQPRSEESDIYMGTVTITLRGLRHDFKKQPEGKLFVEMIGFDAIQDIWGWGMFAR